MSTYHCAYSYNCIILSALGHGFCHDRQLKASWHPHHLLHNTHTIKSGACLAMYSWSSKERRTTVLQFAYELMANHQLTSTLSLSPPCLSKDSKAPSSKSFVTRSLNLAITIANLSSLATRLPTYGLDLAAVVMRRCRWAARLRYAVCCLQPEAIQDQDISLLDITSLKPGPCVPT